MIHKSQGHRKRLRERFLTSGLSGFADYEVIELLLTLATPRQDCKDRAKAALVKFGTFQNVMEAPTSELIKIKGIGETNVFGIKLAKEIAQRYLSKKFVGKDIISNSKELFDYLFFKLRDKDKEFFCVIYLDIKNRVIDAEKLFQGSITSAIVYPREVVKAAIEKKAASVMFAHNHPSGDPIPSTEDFKITKKLTSALCAVDIKVYDHIIIGDNKYYSFADNGHIDTKNGKNK